MKKISLSDLASYAIPRKKVPIRPGIEFLSDWIDRTETKKEDTLGYPTGCWAAFNEYFGGARPELVVLSGETGMGKTTWAMTWLKDTLEQGREACVIPMEMGPTDTIDHLAEMVLGKKGYRATDEDRTTFGQTLDKWPLFLIDHYGPLEEKIVHAAIYYGSIEAKVKFFLIDHIEYIEKDLGRHNDAYVIDDCCRRLAWLAAELKVTILLIVHPAKRGKALRDKVIDQDELKGTSGIKQTGGSILIHHRPKEQSDETYIHLAKIRSREYSKNKGKKIRFGFDAKKSLYLEANFD